MRAALQKTDLEQVVTGSSVVGEAADAEEGAEGVRRRVQPRLPAPTKSGFFGLGRKSEKFRS